MAGLTSSDHFQFLFIVWVKTTRHHIVLKTEVGHKIREWYSHWPLPAHSGQAEILPSKNLPRAKCKQRSERKEVSPRKKPPTNTNDRAITAFDGLRTLSCEYFENAKVNWDCTPKRSLWRELIKSIKKGSCPSYRYGCLIIFIFDEKVYQTQFK